MKIPRIKKTEPTLFASHIIPVNPIIPNDDIEYRTWQDVVIFDPRLCLDNLCDKVQIRRVIFSEQKNKSGVIGIRYEHIIEIIKEYEVNTVVAPLQGLQT